MDPQRPNTTTDRLAEPVRRLHLLRAEIKIARLTHVPEDRPQHHAEADGRAQRFGMAVGIEFLRQMPGLLIRPECS